MSGETLASLRALAAHARFRPEMPAVSMPGNSLSYGELARIVAGAAEEIAGLGPVIGVAGPNGPGWLVADIAAAWTGRCMVPLPPLFSAGQTAHLIRDAGVSAVLWTGAPDQAPGDLGVPVLRLSLEPGGDLPEIVPGARRVIYTSGTTGEPKGVVHGARQMNTVLQGLARAVDASERDIHLSCLPFALLLEEVCGIHLPLMVGGRVHLGAGVPEGLMHGDPRPVIDALMSEQPTTMVLTPQLLAGLTLAFRHGGFAPPTSLRLVAVGGAPVSPALVDEAWSLGWPVHEGYGLSECCSVVALNRPGARASGSVGRPLDGVEVWLEEGEIVVRGASVMSGYLGRDAPRPADVWRTGDLGRIDAQGRLSVTGRKDSLIVTAAGHNVSPEWIEAMIEADPTVAHAIVTGHGQPRLTALVWLSEPGEALLAQRGPAALETIVGACCAPAPGYARPAQVLVAGTRAQARPYFTPAGRPRRDVLAREFRMPA